MTRYAPAARRRVSSPTGRMLAALTSAAQRVAAADTAGRVTWEHGSLVRSLHRTYSWQAISEASGLTPYRLRQIADLWPDDAA